MVIKEPQVTNSLFIDLQNKSCLWWGDSTLISPL